MKKTFKRNAIAAAGAATILSLVLASPSLAHSRASQSGPTGNTGHTGPGPTGYPGNTGPNALTPPNTDQMQLVAAMQQARKQQAVNDLMQTLQRPIYDFQLTGSR